MELRRQNLSQLISDELLERIRSGKLTVGDRLPTEKGLMAEFGVGHNVVREAVQHLVALKVVDVRPGRGIIITSLDHSSALDALAMGRLLSDTTVDDLYAFRMLLETAIAEEAARKASAVDIKRISDSLETYRASLGPRTEIFAADVSFHQQLAAISGNVIYDSVLRTLTDLLAMYRRKTDLVPGAPEKALVEHEAIVEAIKAHEPDQARAAMEIHIRTAMETIAVAVANEQDSDPDSDS